VKIKAATPAETGEFNAANQQDTELTAAQDPQVSHKAGEEEASKPLSSNQKLYSLFANAISSSPGGIKIARTSRPEFDDVPADAEVERYHASRKSKDPEQRSFSMRRVLKS
jgi:hypothetical protein